MSVNKDKTKRYPQKKIRPKRIHVAHVSSTCHGRAPGPTVSGESVTPSRKQARQTYLCLLAPEVGSRCALTTNIISFLAKNK